MFFKSISKGQSRKDLIAQDLINKACHNVFHRRYAEKVRKALNGAKYEKLATKFLTYNSVLLKLEYFDAIRMTAIDPMHNLYQGTAKTMFKLWLERGLLTKKKLKDVEKQIEKLDMGTRLGRLPKKNTFKLWRV